MDKGIIFGLIILTIVPFATGSYLLYRLTQLLVVKRLRSWVATYGRITELDCIDRSSATLRWRAKVSFSYSDGDGLEHTSVEPFISAGKDFPYEVGSYIFLLYRPEEPEQCLTEFELAGNDMFDFKCNIFNSSENCLSDAKQFYIRIAINAALIIITFVIAASYYDTNYYVPMLYFLNLAIGLIYGFLWLYRLNVKLQRKLK